MDFDKPENEGLSGARNFYISTDLKVEVGVWHILPQGNFLKGYCKVSLLGVDSLWCDPTFIPADWGS